MVGEFFSSKLCLASVFSLICFSHPIFAEYDPITYFSRQSSEVKVEPVIPVESEEVAPLIADMDQQNTAFFCTPKDKNPQPAPPPVVMKPAERKSRLEFGGNYTRLNLKPHGHKSFNGNLGGAQAMYEYRPADRIYGALKGVWKEGHTHGGDGKRSILYFDAQERIGYTVAASKMAWRLTLFSGFGYRFIRHKLEPKVGSSVRFNYNEFYFPVGFLTNYDVNSWFAFGVDFTWMPQVYPTVTIVPLKGARWVLTRELGNYYVEVPFTFTVTKSKSFQIIVNPFYERWQDGHTTAKLPSGIALGLPGNTYNFYGAELNLAFNF